MQLPARFALKPKFLIILAIAVAIVLIGVSFYFLRAKSQKDLAKFISPETSENGESGFEQAISSAESTQEVEKKIKYLEEQKLAKFEKIQVQPKLLLTVNIDGKSVPLIYDQNFLLDCKKKEFSNTLVVYSSTPLELKRKMIEEFERVPYETRVNVLFNYPKDGPAQVSYSPNAGGANMLRSITVFMDDCRWRYEL